MDGKRDRKDGPAVQYDTSKRLDSMLYEYLVGPFLNNLEIRFIICIFVMEV
ncbi:MAG: hypothetical protein GF317_10115 [Candidatus Lokiarchaeota archaeon]|nr:hypothetical protein [Candidatus Lokiarchaeota archaeon]